MIGIDETNSEMISKSTHWKPVFLDPPKGKHWHGSPPRLGHHHLHSCLEFFVSVFFPLGKETHRKPLRRFCNFAMVREDILHIFCQLVVSHIWKSVPTSLLQQKNLPVRNCGTLGVLPKHFTATGHLGLGWETSPCVPVTWSVSRWVKTAACMHLFLGFRPYSCIFRTSIHGFFKNTMFFFHAFGCFRK